MCIGKITNDFAFQSWPSQPPVAVRYLPNRKHFPFFFFLHFYQPFRITNDDWSKWSNYRFPVNVCVLSYRYTYNIICNYLHTSTQFFFFFNLLIPAHRYITCVVLDSPIAATAAENKKIFTFVYKMSNRNRFASFWTDGIWNGYLSNFLY